MFWKSSSFTEYKFYLQARAKQREFEIDTLHDAMFG